MKVMASLKQPQTCVTTAYLRVGMKHWDKVDTTELSPGSQPDTTGSQLTT